MASEQKTEGSTTFMEIGGAANGTALETINSRRDILKTMRVNRSSQLHPQHDIY